MTFNSKNVKPTFLTWKSSCIKDMPQLMQICKCLASLVALNSHENFNMFIKRQTTFCMPDSI